VRRRLLPNDADWILDVPPRFGCSTTYFYTLSVPGVTARPRPGEGGPNRHALPACVKQAKSYIQVAAPPPPATQAPGQPQHQAARHTELPQRHRPLPARRLATPAAAGPRASCSGTAPPAWWACPRPGSPPGSRRRTPCAGSEWRVSRQMGEQTQHAWHVGRSRSSEAPAARHAGAAGRPHLKRSSCSSTLSCSITASSVSAALLLARCLAF
jgi:hypothetical protein